jgi:hypothetical protein
MKSSYKRYRYSLEKRNQLLAGLELAKVSSKLPRLFGDIYYGNFNAATDFVLRFHADAVQRQMDPALALDELLNQIPEKHRLACSTRHQVSVFKEQEFVLHRLLPVVTVRELCR